MKIIHAFRYRSVPDEHGTWGNGTVNRMLKRFPWIRPLVAEITAEHKWSKPHREGANEWSALFFEDHIKGQKTEISVTIMPSRKNLVVPSLVLDRYSLPTLVDIEHWIIANIRRGE